MKHRKFVVGSTIVMLLILGVVGGLALYSTMTVKASIPGLPDAVAYLPADAQAVFGMNVQKFIASPVYARMEQKHGQEIGADLADFIAKTGVDPRKDILYIIAAGRSAENKKGTGVIIAAGNFNTAAITSFINTKAVPIRVDYADAIVLMIPEKDGSKVEKGIAFLSEKEIALGELEQLKSVLDIRKGLKQGVLTNPTLGPLIRQLNSDEMFWFAGDASSVLTKAPTNTPLGGSISAITHVFGTLNLTDVVDGTIMVTAKDAESAGKLADVARGLVALGQLASEQTANADLAELMKGVSIRQGNEEKSRNQIILRLNFSIDLLDKLEKSKPAAAAKKVA